MSITFGIIGSNKHNVARNVQSYWTVFAWYSFHLAIIQSRHILIEYFGTLWRVMHRSTQKDMYATKIVIYRCFICSHKFYMYDVCSSSVIFCTRCFRISAMRSKNLMKYIPDNSNCDSLKRINPSFQPKSGDHLIQSIPHASMEWLKSTIHTLLHINQLTRSQWKDIVIFNRISNGIYSNSK